MAEDFAEKRKYERIKKNTVIYVMYKSDDSGIQAEEQTITEDLSAGGVRISLPEQLPRDKVLDLQVFLFSDPIPLPAKGKVVWSYEKQKFEVKKSAAAKEEKEKNYWAGIQFVDIDPDTRERIIRLVKKEFLEKE